MNKCFTDMYSLTMQQEGVTGSRKQHPEFTTYKYRAKEGWVKRTIDYIFMAKNQFANRDKAFVSRYMDPAQVERDGLLNTEIAYPAPEHPSDHFSIAYEIVLTI